MPEYIMLGDFMVILLISASEQTEGISEDELKKAEAEHDKPHVHVKLKAEKKEQPGNLRQELERDGAQFEDKPRKTKAVSGGGQRERERESERERERESERKRERERERERGLTKQKWIFGMPQRMIDVKWDWTDE